MPINNRSLRVIACALPALILPVFCCADEIILNGDGTEIRLKDDGSWERVSDKIYLDTAAGRRVVLEPDGRWSYVGLAPKVKEDQYRELLFEINIVDAVIKETREKVGSGKNYRTESSTHLTLAIGVAASAQQPLSLAGINKENFAVVDKRGKRYPVTAIETGASEIAVGESANLRLVCKGAPSAFARSKVLMLTVAKAAFDTQKDVQLEINYDDIERERINL